MNKNVTIDRNSWIGGSDCPYILGMASKWGKTPFLFAQEKAGIIPNTFKGNEITRYGQYMESIIRDYINALYNVNYLEDTVIDEERGYRGNTDGIDRNADIPILEVKTFGEELDVDYYTPQCQFYMEVFNQDACLLVGYKRPKDFYTGLDYDLENDKSYFNLEFNPDDLVIHTIYRDSNLWSKIESRIIAFKKGVEYLKEHKTDYSEDEFNKMFYGDDLIVTTNKLSELETRLSTMKELEKEQKRLKDKLYELFDEKGIISFDTGTMKITKVAPTSYDTVTIDTKKLKEENEEIYNKYKVTKTTNRKGYLLITLRKDK